MVVDGGSIDFSFCPLIYSPIEKYKYYPRYYLSMSKGIRTLNLQFTDEMFMKIKRKKDKSGAKSWEDFIISVVSCYTGEYDEI
jgi:hypothetical protein